MTKRTVGRPKIKLPHEFQMVIPKDTLMNQAKRSYWLLRQMEHALAKDISAVKSRDYHDALEKYVTLCEELKKKGYGTSSRGKPTKRVDAGGNDKGDSEQSGSSGVGQDGQADMGAGVRAVNPIT